MKNLKLTILLLTMLFPLMVNAASSDIIINEENFPDENFRAYLMRQSYGKDGIITKEEIKNIFRIDVSYKYIINLKGIEYFTTLTHLDCIDNQLTSLDVSKNLALTYLCCNENQLTSLDVSKNTALTDLRCGLNQLTSLNVSECTALDFLDCGYNQLTNLDVSKNTALMELGCAKNQLTSIDVSNNTALKRLYCNENQLTSLDVSNNSSLTYLWCNDNQLTSLDVSKNMALTFLYCYDNKIKGEAMDALVGSLPNRESAVIYIIDLSNSSEENVCTSIQVKTAKEKGWKVLTSSGDLYVGCDTSPSDIIINKENFPDASFRNSLLNEPYGKDGIISDEEIQSITILDISGRWIKDLKGIEFFTALEMLWCNNNYLTSLDVSKNTALTYLQCYNNQLTSIDVSKNTALTYLECSINQLSNLDVSRCTALTELNCWFNQLSYLDVSRCTALTFLGCGRNQLTSLDVSKCTALTELNCGDNQLTSLDVSNNTALTYLACEGNQLTSLDVSRNTTLTKLFCYNNKIKGEAMDALVGSLPNRESAEMRVIDLSNSSEENVCTTIQVNVAKEKGWRVLTSSGNDYDGSDPSGNDDDIIINDVNFPDENFRAFLKEQPYGEDGIITEEEIKNVFSIDVSRRNITNLKGIEYFTALTYLYCFSNKLTSLNVSECTALTGLICFYNQLTSLDVSKNTALTELNCFSNQLTSLDVSECTALTYLDCYDNQLTSLDVSKNTALTELYCPYNHLTRLDVTKNIALTELNCCQNQLKNLDVSKNTALTSLYCYDNKIKGEAMDVLVESLPIQLSAEMRVIDLSNSSEENVCTTIQVNTAREKGWKVLNSTGYDYEGSDPSGIQGITLENNVNTSIYDLNGRRLKEPSKGINIIGGKKVLNH